MERSDRQNHPGFDFRVRIWCNREVRYALKPLLDEHRQLTSSQMLSRANVGSAAKRDVAWTRAVEVDGQRIVGDRLIQSVEQVGYLDHVTRAQLNAFEANIPGDPASRIYDAMTADKLFHGIWNEPRVIDQLMTMNRIQRQEAREEAKHPRYGIKPA